MLKKNKKIDLLTLVLYQLQYLGYLSIFYNIKYREKVILGFKVSYYCLFSKAQKSLTYLGEA